MRKLLHYLFGFHTYKEKYDDLPSHVAKCLYCEKSILWNETTRGYLILYKSLIFGDILIK